MPTAPSLPSLSIAGNAVQMILSIVLGIAGIALVVGLVYMWRAKKGPFKRWTIKALVLERRSGFVYPTWDRVRLIADKTGKMIYEFKSSKFQIPAMDFKNILPGDMLIVYSPNRGEYHPVSFNEIKIDVTTTNAATGKTETTQQTGLDISPTINESMRLAYAQEVLNTYNRFHIQSFFEKYGGILTILALALGIVIILYVAVQQITPLFQSANGLVSKLSDACITIAQANGKLPANYTSPPG